MGLGMTEHHHHDHGYHHGKCISWSAIIIGALVGIGLSFLLNLFSVAIGLSVYNTSSEGAMTLAVGGFIALIIGIIVSMFMAGYVAGFIAEPYRRCNVGLLYGFATWCLALIITVLLMSHVGRYVNTFSNTVSNPTMVIVNNDNEAPLAQQTSPRTVEVNAEKATRAIGLSAFITFVLFFIGAISSCTGAYVAMNRRNYDIDNYNRTDVKRDDFRPKM